MESKEFRWKNQEFIQKSVEFHQVSVLATCSIPIRGQLHSKYQFYDISCILSIRFQVQFLGCQKKPTYQFHILSVGGSLYIYIYMYIARILMDYTITWACIVNGFGVKYLLRKSMFRSSRVPSGSAAQQQISGLEE